MHAAVRFFVATVVVGIFASLAAAVAPPPTTPLVPVDVDAFVRSGGFGPSFDYHDFRTGAASTIEARVDVPEIPETPYGDGGFASATPTKVTAKSASFGNGLHSTGPWVQATSNGRRVRVEWPSDGGPPATIQDPASPGGPQLELQIAVMPFSVQLFFDGSRDLSNPFAT